MDARPNVLNKILPCTKRIMFSYRSGSAPAYDVYLVYGRSMDDSSDENIAVVCQIPQDYIAGSAFHIIIGYCILTANPAGADKKVRIVTEYNYGRSGIVVSGTLNLTPILVTIPDGELRWMIRWISLGTIPNMLVGDWLSVRLTRDADHVDDTYVGDFMVLLPIVGQYITDKIGVV